MPDPQVVLVTGSTDGLGREVAFRAAASGAHVIVHGRNPDRGAAVVSQIENAGAGTARFYQADFASLAEVRAFARAVVQDHDRLDLLVNSAGIGSTKFGSRELSADGHELLFAVNYLAGVVLTRELLPLMLRSTPSHIINVSSLGQAPIDFDDVMLERDYSDMRAYCQSKLAQILFTFDLAEALDGQGVTVNCLHPATFMDTKMVVDAGFEPQATVDEGAAAVMHLVTAPALDGGQYFNGTTPGRALDQAYDTDAREQLRKLSESLTSDS